MGDLLEDGCGSETVGGKIEDEDNNTDEIYEAYSS